MASEDEVTDSEDSPFGVVVCELPGDVEVDEQDVSEISCTVVAMSSAALTSLSSLTKVLDLRRNLCLAGSEVSLLVKPTTWV